jgi:hypothetical protein
MEIGYDDLDDKEKLIYDIVFSEEVYTGTTLFEIKLYDYIKDLSELTEFTNYVLDSLKEANFVVTEDVLVMTNDTNVWKLKIKNINI